MEQREDQEMTWLKIRVPSALHHDLKVLAATEDRTLTAQVTKILREYLEWSRSQS